MKSKPIRVPSHLAADVEEVVNAINDAAHAQGHDPTDLMRVTRANSKEMVGGGVETIFLILGAGAAWFTKKWFDTFVWPKLEGLLQEPSQRAVDFLFATLPVTKKDN
jgi:hypothetical protein